MSAHIATADELRQAAQAIADNNVVFVDTEFHAEHRYRPKLYLVQVGVADGRAWIIDPVETGAIAAVKDALLATSWVVHGGHHDMVVLGAALGGLPDRIWDTQIAAGLVGPRFPAPFGQLVRDHLGESLDKTATLTDWSKRPLTDAQLGYALRDVEWLIPLWHNLRDQVEAQDRTGMLAAACDAARTRAAEPPPSDEAWRSIGPRWTLNRQQSAVLQELAGWRQRTARGLNQPPRRIASDGILMGFARRQPADLASLTQDRRMPRGLVKTHGPALIDHITRAAARPDWAWPHSVARHTPQGRALLVLDLAVRAAGVAHGFAPDLLLPHPLAEDVVLSAARDEEGLTSILGWRAGLVEPVIREALAGSIALTMAGGDVAIVPC